MSVDFLTTDSSIRYSEMFDAWFEEPNEKEPDMKWHPLTLYDQSWFSLSGSRSAKNDEDFGPFLRRHFCGKLASFYEFVERNSLLLNVIIYWILFNVSYL